MPHRNEALDRWLLRTSGFWLLVLPPLAVWIINTGPTLAQFAIWGGGTLAGQLWLVRALHVRGTLADKVTLGRFALLLACLGLAWSEGAVTWPLWLGIGFALLADLADGYLARRFGSSQAGAMLDMETDQAATLGLAMLLIGCCGVGPWVLMLPGFRYAYVVLLRILRIPAADPKPCDGDNRRAKLICALMMILLFLATGPFVAPAIASGCAAVSVLLLAYSYGSDVRFLIRRRPVETTE